MDIREAERLILASPDHRLTRRVPPIAQWGLAPANAETRRAVLVDTETTGLDPDADEVIELALLPFEYERDTGRIVSVDEAQALSAFRQPSFPIPAESTRLHGISNEMVAGRSIDAAAVRRLVGPAHLVIAHNAGFDRPMLEKHWPLFEDKHFACSFVDIDWKGEGIGSAKLDYLLYAQGWFHDGHRALSDALATLFLLALPLPQSGKLALASLLECARRPLRAVRAEETAFEQRAALKARGYRWDEGGGKRAKAWWIMTSDPDAEVNWLRGEIYRDETREIAVVNAPPTRRYSARLWAG
ncbi:MAG: DNA polymerase III subunit epsilon [Alphaproteobacteria bacterium]|nr:MAG: DNA polymerase III subunit epsilon [Alphaproteobacteria bacterium]